MSVERKIRRRRLRRQFRSRRSILGTEHRPRVSVFRSLSNISAQVIDDVVGRTLVSGASFRLEKALVAKKSKSEVAGLLGLELAKKALEKDIKEVVFDRGCFLYHGRVKAFAEGLRKGGLVF